MLPIPTMLMIGGLFTGPIDARPELLLPVRFERLPGESELAYFKRELARIDGLMQRCKADVARMQRNAALAEQQWETLMKACLEKEVVKLATEAEALKVLVGGMADHPKASFTAPKPSIDELLEREKAAIRESVEDRMKASKAQTAQVLERVRQINEEVEQRARERRERAEKKKK
ncbi:MAG: hypothetical protein ACOVT5_01270 [Armatimonadaceae bacterium]